MRPSISHLIEWFRWWQMHSQASKTDCNSAKNIFPNKLSPAKCETLNILSSRMIQTRTKAVKLTAFQQKIIFQKNWVPRNWSDNDKCIYSLVINRQVKLTAFQKKNFKKHWVPRNVRPSISRDLERFRQQQIHLQLSYK